MPTKIITKDSTFLSLHCGPGDVLVAESLEVAQSWSYTLAKGRELIRGFREGGPSRDKHSDDEQIKAWDRGYHEGHEHGLIIGREKGLEEGMLKGVQWAIDRMEAQMRE